MPTRPVRSVSRRSSSGSSLLFLLLLVLLAASRSPHIARYGRFWAEEGGFFFTAIDAAPGLTGIFYVYPEAGYFTFVTNVIVLAATHLPLTVAPLFTSWTSMLVVVGIAHALHRYLVRHPSAATDPTLRVVAYVAPVLLLVSPGSFPEAWANTINLPHHLAILSFLLLVAFPADPQRASVTRLLLPFVLGISSPYSALIGLLEWFAPRGIARGRQRIAAASASLGFLVQAGVFMERNLRSGITGERPLDLSVVRLVDNAAFALSSASVGQARTLGLVAGLDAGASVFLVGYGLSVITAVALLALLLSGTDRHFRSLAAASFAVVVLMVTLAAFQGIGRGRYAVASVGILVVTAALALFVAGPEDRREASPTRTAAFMLFALLVVSAGDFWTVERSAFLACDGCPDWSAEVAKVDGAGSDPADLGIWPYPDWTMRVERSR